MSGGLPGFLTARWDEEQRVAEQAAPGPWEFTDRGWQLRLTADAPNFERVAMVEQPSEAQWWAIRHAANWDPDRVLAEVEAKRRILAEVVPMIDEASNGFDREFGRVPEDRYLSFESKALLLALAAPYKGHPDYAQAEAETERDGLGGWK